MEFLAPAYKGISEYPRPTAIEVLKHGGIYISPKIIVDGAQSIMLWMRRFDQDPKGGCFSKGRRWSGANANNGHVDAIKVWNESVSTKKNDGRVPMHFAAKNGHVDAVKTLKEMGADISEKNNNGGTAMHRAAIKGHVDTIKALHEMGADISGQTDHGGTPNVFCSVVWTSPSDQGVEGPGNRYLTNQ